ncbi:MAG: Asp-tRNA(Asn)/Glu-tRNA(Gln) amidotransferase subunit GatB [Gammaproteobacteria bacterium]|nr:Asp-tRNA(Asn)/Glu-tRNA(Gln) amidotransferase subunit GatB [Gammaproteobacteria bacterium]
MSWEAVIGLEVHVQLATKSKIFSGASPAFGGAPNSQACPVDIGLPGVLPVLNAEAVRMAVKFGLAIDAEIYPYSIFDRKNYFYPDLPKGYQISQFAHPIVGPGTLDIRMENGDTVAVGITRAHLEEDAGKSLHTSYPGMTGIDLNRTGTPLLEVVSEPDMRSPAQAVAYFRQLHKLVRYLEICDGNLAEGSMRCDANVSVRPLGSSELGERSEIKNINSFRFVEKAIAFEIERQIDILESGGKVRRDTRQYDSERNETRSMRTKELSDDYRYFPDPDLLPVHLTSAYIAEVKASLPELPEARLARFRTELGLNDYDAAWLTNDPVIADYFEAALSTTGDAKLTANWIMGDASAALHRDELEWGDCPVPAAELGRLIARIKDDTISSKLAKTIFDALWVEEGTVDEIIDVRGLRQLSDSAALRGIVKKILNENPSQVAQYQTGKNKVLGFFVGQVMKATQGRANPGQVNELLLDSLKEGATGKE